LAGCHTAIRETWGADLVGKADLRFFVGRGDAQLLGDERRLNVPDDYQSLPFKTAAICSWTIFAGYDHVFKADTDTCILPDRLLDCGWETADYLGKFFQREDFAYPYAEGGNGYFLSRRACELVADMPVVHWAEDLCVGQVLGPAIQDNKLIKLEPLRFDRYCTRHRRHAIDNDDRTVSVPRWMKRHYRGRLDPSDELGLETEQDIRPPQEVLRKFYLKFLSVRGLSQAQVAYALDIASFHFRTHDCEEPSEQDFANMVEQARRDRS
jgi:hypothetical protein